MKFTKDDARKDLMSKIPSKGETLQLSERSINEQLETLMPLLANEETELDDFVSRVLPIFKTADANIRANVSAQVREYKEQNPVPQPTKKQEGGKVEDDALKALLTRIDELEAKNAQNERIATLANRKTEVVGKMKEKGCKDEEWIETFMSVVNLEGEDFNAENLADQYIGVYNKSKSKYNPDITPSSTGGGKKDAYLEEVLGSAAEFAKSQRLEEV